MHGAVESSVWKSLDQPGKRFQMIRQPFVVGIQERNIVRPRGIQPLVAGSAYPLVVLRKKAKSCHFKASDKLASTIRGAIINNDNIGWFQGLSSN
jgi:hypothetical protein